MSFGVGFSTENGALVDASIRERNLLGKGQNLSLKTTMAQRRTEFDLSFTEPYFLGRDLSAGFDLFTITTDLQRQSSYDWQSTGESLRLGYKLQEDLRQGLKYTLRQDKISNVSPYASTYVQDQRGNRVLSMLSQNLIYDLRDSRIDPTEGYFLRLGNDLAGLGGDTQFLRTDISGGRYWPLADQWILSMGGEAGYVDGLGEDLGFNYRYFLGGRSLRGFSSGGIGPRSRTGKEALGGNWTLSGTAELAFPIGLPNELGLNGKLFTDVGTLGKPDNFVFDDMFHYTSPRVSMGGGLVGRSPMGPINMDLAYPLVKDSYDETEALRLNLGTRF